MRHLVRRRPSPAMVVASLALLVALGGTSYATVSLPRNSVGAVQLKNGAVTPPKVAKRTVALFKGQRGPQGPPGPQGAQGPAGAVGPSTGPAGGALAGSYPNPSLADGSVTTPKFAADAQAPNAARLGGLLPGQFPQLASGTASPAVPMRVYAYFMTTGTVTDYPFGQARLRTTGTAGQFQVCGNVPGTTGTFSYVAYVNGARSAGTVGSNGCSPAFTVGAGGDFVVTIRRAIIFGVHSGDGVTNRNYNTYGFSQL
jgi:hypothetical protein